VSGPDSIPAIHGSHYATCRLWWGRKTPQRWALEGALERGVTRVSFHSAAHDCTPTADPRVEADTTHLHKPRRMRERPTIVGEA
jgi:hypothetical protein